MSQIRELLRTRPITEGFGVGLLTWLLGYGLTYLLVSDRIRESLLEGAIQFVGGRPATYELVGWVFYNAHFVSTTFRNIPLLGTESYSFIGGDDGFSVVLYLIPAGLLLAAGLALGRYVGVTDPRDGALAGVAVVPGYFVGAVVSIWLVTITVQGIHGGPDILTAVLIAGLAYPTVFASGGGLLAALTSS